MNLLTSVLIIAIVVVAIIFVAYYAYGLIYGSSSQQVTEQQAESLITTDLQANYPNAVVNITNASPSSYSGSWHIVVSVVVNASSPCPSYFINTYDYPAFRFNPTPQNTYTTNCNIYVFSPSGAFKLGSAPVAIAWATRRVPSVAEYVSLFGASNVNAEATYAANATTGGTWSLVYSSASANYTAHALLADTNGTLLSSYNASA